MKPIPTIVSVIDLNRIKVLLRQLFLSIFFLCIGSTAQAQNGFTAWTYPVNSLDKFKESYSALKNNKALIMQFADIYGVDLDLNANTENELKALGFSDSERKKLFIISSVMRTRWNVSSPKDSLEFLEAMKQTLNDQEANLLSDPAFEREKYIIGIGPMFDDISSESVQIGKHLRLNAPMISYGEESHEIKCHWAKSQVMILSEADKHVQMGGVDLTDAFYNMGALKKPDQNSKASGISRFLSKAKSVLDGTNDTYWGPMFPIPQLYMLAGTSFSVRFRSDQSTEGLAIYLVPMDDRCVDGLSPSYAYRRGKSNRPPNPKYFSEPYEARSYKVPTWDGMFGYVGNFPNGVSEGLWMAIIAPKGRPLEAEQTLYFSSSKELRKDLLNLPPWW